MQMSELMMSLPLNFPLILFTVTAYYGKNWGKILRRELLPQFFTNSHEIWHRCLPLGVDVQDTFFDSGRKCVAMVTAYYTVKKYCGAGVLITFSDISSLIWGHAFTCLSKKKNFKNFRWWHQQLIHLHIFIYRLFKKCFVENYKHSKFHPLWLIINLIYFNFHCSVQFFLNSFYWINLNLDRTSPLSDH